MKFGVLREREEGETRVALVPGVVKNLVKKGHTVLFERGAGARALISDEELTEAGAEACDVDTVFAKADCLLKVAPPTDGEADRLREGQGLVSFVWPARNEALMARLMRRRATVFAMDAIPRITRAQSMDALSSQATVAGYKAVLLAADRLPKFLPMLTTAAGTIRPAQGLIIGAGVAGLQAIATARRLGAVVEAYDTRPVVKEQVLSLGAKFIELDVGGGPQGSQDKYGYAKEASADTLARQQALLLDRASKADFVITTAQIPGKPAPRLITREAVAAMKPGSVVIDLAAETGGNCELTKAGERVVVHGVTIEGPLNLPAQVPLDASRMYANNVGALLAEIVIADGGGFTLDWNNEVFRETCVTHAGEPRRRA